MVHEIQTNNQKMRNRSNNKNKSRQKSHLAGLFFSYGQATDSTIHLVDVGLESLDLLFRDLSTNFGTLQILLDKNDFARSFLVFTILLKQLSLQKN